MLNVFVYGTLMFPEVAIPVAGIEQHGEPATLLGYRRYEASTRDRGNYPAIIEDPSASVDGLLFRNVSAAQIKKLDSFERVEGELYSRASGEIQIAEDTISVEFYVAGELLFTKLRKPLTKAWSPELFRRNELEWYLQNEVGV